MADENVNPDKLSVDEVFGEAIRRTAGDVRDAYLDEVCGDDLPLRQRVARLLKASDEAQSFLESPALDHSLSNSPAIAEQPGDAIGDFRLLQQIGEGGFGVVYMADQLRPVKRRVALKIIKPGMDTKEVVARFEAERQALALMDHVHIAKVLDGGATDSGRPYFVMELVKGVTLTEYCDANRLPMQRRLELFGQVCRAIQHAHQKGVIHRDIKPSNVMVTMHDGEPVPKVIDFGVAKAISHELTEKTMFTVYGQMIGTPQYMSPEQAEMSGLDVDTRSDVYSLGVLLYELITGTTPLDKDSIQRTAYRELCRQIREIEAPKPSARISTLKDIERSAVAEQRQVKPASLQTFVSGDLDRVVLKALQKDREQRYESPKELAADLKRFLNDEPVQAMPPSAIYLARKYFGRHRAAILTTALILSLLIVSTAFSMWQAIRATRYGKESEVAKNEAVAAKRVADGSKLLAEKTSEQRRRELYVANIQLAAQIWSRPDGNQRQIEDLLAAWVPVDEQPDLRDFAWRYQWSLLHHNSQQTLFDNSGSVFSPAGNLFTSGTNGIREWDRAGGLVSQRWGEDASQCVFSSDGSWAAIPTKIAIQLIDLKTGISHPLPGTRITFSSDGRFIACWQGEGDIAVWDVESETPRQVDALRSTGLAGTPAQPALTLAPDGKSFLLHGRITPNRHEVLAFLHGRTAPLRWTYPPPVSSCAWSPNGNLIAIGLLSGKIHLHHKARPEQRVIFGSHGTNISTLTFSGDSSKMASGGRDGTIDIWDIQGDPNASAAPTVQTPTLVRSIKAHVEAVQSIAFSPDGTQFVSTDKLGVTKRWETVDDGGAILLEDVADNLFGGTTGVEFEIANGSVTVTGFTTGYPAAESQEIAVGDQLLGISRDGSSETVRFAGMSEANVTKALLGPPDSRVTLHLQKKNGNRTTTELTRQRIKRIMSYRVAYSPKADSLAVASYWFGATLWNTAERRARRLPFRGYSVAYSPDGKYLAMDDVDRIVIWDLRIGDIHASFPLRQSMILSDRFTTIDLSRDGGASLSISPDGRSLAAGTGSPFNHRYRRSVLHVWDLEGLQAIPANDGVSERNGQSDAPLYKNQLVHAEVVFALGGKRLIAADHQGVIRIWDTRTWSLQQTLGGWDDTKSLEPNALNFGQATAMAIARDGTTLAIGFGFTQSASSAVVLWDVAANKPIRTVSVPRPMGLAFSANGRTLASTDEYHEVTLWDVATGLPLRSLDAHTNAVFGVDFSSDGTKLATTDIDGVLRIWEAQSFDEIDRHPLTLRSMFRLGAKQNRERRFAEAESTLRRVLEIQKDTLSVDDPRIAETQAEITKSLEGQGRLPVFVLQPESIAAAEGDEVVFRTKLSNGDWTVQWYRNGKAIDGAIKWQVGFQVNGEEDFGCYHAEAVPKGLESIAAPVRSGYGYVVETQPVRNRGLRWEVFNDIPGKLIADLTASEKYQRDEPDDRSIIQDFEIPSDAGDYYGGRATGLLTPPVTGQYVFYVCSDGQGRLFLNASDDWPEREEMIADTRWTPKRQWRSRSAKSQPIFLKRGKRYSIRALFKEGASFDYLAVAWQMPGQPPPNDGDPPIPGLFLQHRPE